MKINFLQNQILGNTLLDYCWLFGARLLGFIFKQLISKYLSQLLYKIIGRKDDDIGAEKFNELLVKPIGLCVMLSIIYIGASHISFPLSWNLVEKEEFGLKMFLNKGFSLLYIYSIFWIIIRFVDYISLILHEKAEQTENRMDDQLIPFVIDIIKIITYIFGLIIVMGNVFNVNITALATGLGIGGIAIAMASKESLENLLGSFTIFLDQPLQLGI